MQDKDNHAVRKITGLMLYETGEAMNKIRFHKKFLSYIIYTLQGSLVFRMVSDRASGLSQA